MNSYQGLPKSVRVNRVYTEKYAVDFVIDTNLAPNTIIIPNSYKIDNYSKLIKYPCKDHTDIIPLSAITYSQAKLKRKDIILVSDKSVFANDTDSWITGILVITKEIEDNKKEKWYDCW